MMVTTVIYCDHVTKHLMLRLFFQSSLHLNDFAFVLISD